MDRHKFLIDKVKWLVDVREEIEKEDKAFSPETLAEHIGMLIDEFLEKRIREARKVLDIHPEINFPINLDPGSKIIFHTRDVSYIAIIEEARREEGRKEYIH